MVDIITLNSREDWLAKRKNYIGGSEASCVIGLNPYMTNVDLWRDKTGRQEREDISDKDFVRYGTEAEGCLRRLFMLDYPNIKVHYIPNNMWLNSEYPFAHASLDGWLVDDQGRLGVLEIKTTNILQSMQKEKWNHRIPENYYVQVLHYLAVTEAEFAILKAQLKYDYDGDIMLTTKHYSIERADVEKDIEYLMQAEKSFFEYIKSDKEPPLVLPTI